MIAWCISILSNAHTVRGRPTLTNHIDSYISNNSSKKCQIRSSRTLEQHHTLLCFSYTHEFWRSKANWHFRFTLLPIILADLLGNTRFLRWVEKVMTCDFRSVLWGSVFQGSSLVIVMTINGSEKRNCEGGFWASQFSLFTNFQMYLFSFFLNFILLGCMSQNFCATFPYAQNKIAPSLIVTKTRR